MKKSVNPIRDMNLIEKELNESPSGVLALRNNDDDVVQRATNFLYLDKNVYIFFGEEDEFYEKINFDHYVNFTVIKNSEIKKTKRPKFIPSYYLFSITVTGIIKKVEDAKVIDNLYRNYSRKYSSDSKQENLDFSVIKKIILIDTEEIQAFEEVGA